jgi:type II secretory pathway pseudopilin PulG
MWVSLFCLIFGLIVTWSGWFLFTNRPYPILFKKIWIKSLYEKILTIPTPLRKKVLIGLSVLVLFLIMTFFVWPSEQKKARESEAKTWIGTLNRAQQGYFTEKGTFTSDINMLEAVIPYSKYYVFSIPTPGVALALTNSDSQKRIIEPSADKISKEKTETTTTKKVPKMPLPSNNKSAKTGVSYRDFDSNIKSYIGGVSFNPTTKTFSTVICRQTGNEPLTMESITGYGVVQEGKVACGPNTEKVQ